MAIAIFSLPVMFILLVLLKPFTRFERVNKWHNRLHRYLIYNHCITVVFESYTILAICSAINIKYVRSFSLHLIYLTCLGKLGNLVGQGVNRALIHIIQLLLCGAIRVRNYLVQVF